MQCCKDCKNFSKYLNICVDKRMGDTPEYYDNPKWMGCSYYIDPKGQPLELFGEEDHVIQENRQDETA